MESVTQRINSTMKLVSHMEAIPWNQCLAGSLKVRDLLVMSPFDEDGSVAESLDSLGMCSLELFPHVLHPRHHSHPTTSTAKRGLQTPKLE
jgi:hypothetical protein